MSFFLGFFLGKKNENPKEKKKKERKINLGFILVQKQENLWR